MGIPGPGQSLETGQSTFSDDLLSIELCGPDKQNLSVIDIPGIFRTPTEGVTTEDDMALVRKIMYRHIRDERTIILAVIPSNTDIATQEILSIAKEVDPKGLRTLGVLTKPDLVDKGGEENVMGLVQGKRNPLRLGYCIVRNRGQSELGVDSAERYKKERNFFSTEPWAKLDRDRVGTAALQGRLHDLLIDITRREFPKVQAQIVQQLSSCRKRLEALGADRQSTDQQRRYLLEMSSEFQDITNYALDAYYSRHVIFSNSPELRLATLCVDRNDKFSDEVLRVGHSIQFDTQDDEAETAIAHTSTTSTPPSENDVGSSISNEDVKSYAVQYTELSDLIPSNSKILEPNDRNILEWIGEEYRKARGFGLATIGPSILPTIWQEQSKNWEGLTMAYISDIVFYVHDFICKVLAHICPDERVRSGLWSALQELLVERYQKAITHVKFIIQVERLGTPLTSNHYFNENLQKFKTHRLEQLLGKHAANTYDSNGCSSTDLVVKLPQIRQSMTMNNAEHTIQDIHDILKSYYKVARKRFVDTVCMQGSDFHLLTGDVSPLRIFGTSFVSDLSPAQLDIIAGEEASIKQLRKSLTNEINALEEGKKILRA
jgi:Dynamin central region/Dynamin family